MNTNYSLCGVKSMWNYYYFRFIARDIDAVKKLCSWEHENIPLPLLKGNLLNVETEELKPYSYEASGLLIDMLAQSFSAEHLVIELRLPKDQVKSSNYELELPLGGVSTVTTITVCEKLTTKSISSTFYRGKKYSHLHELFSTVSPDKSVLLKESENLKSQEFLDKHLRIAKNLMDRAIIANDPPSWMIERIKNLSTDVESVARSGQRSLGLKPNLAWYELHKSEIAELTIFYETVPHVKRTTLGLLDCILTLVLDCNLKYAIKLLRHLNDNGNSPLWMTPRIDKLKNIIEENSSSDPAWYASHKSEIDKLNDYLASYYSLKAKWVD
jgi:hypothetical protein